MQKIAVLFVCLGNICRSPAAEGTFRHLVKQAGLEHAFHIDSCGTSAYHIGEPANARSRRTAARHGITLTSRARQLQLSDFQTFDHILAMDRSNLQDIQRMAPADPHATITLFRTFDPEAKSDRVPDVPDPYYGGDDGFEEVQQIMLRTGASFLRHIREAAHE